MNVQRWIRRPVSAGVAVVLAVALGAPAAFGQALLIGQPRVMDVRDARDARDAWDARDSRLDRERTLFEWRGDVDREVRLVMRGENVWTNPVGQSERPRARMRTFGRLPSRDGEVRVRVLDGRGDVDVIQQPTRRNGYTTIVRIRDPRSGSDNYRLAAYWVGDDVGYDVYGDSRDPNARNRGPNGHGNGNGNGNGRDVYRDRDDDDDRSDRGDRNGQYGQYGYEREALHWSGNVDDELELRIQDGRVEYRTLSGSQPTNVRASVGSTTVPGSGASLSVAQLQGRGSVTVVQQPSQWNGNTTVVRVRDPQGGAGFYEFGVVWR